MYTMFNTHVFHRNEVVLGAGEKYSFNEDGSEMTIMDVTKLDEGEYTCIAKNKAGESEQELSLRVFGKAERFIYIRTWSDNINYSKSVGLSYKSM